MPTLRDLRPGEAGVVAKMNGQGPVKRRLMEMGLTKGVRVEVKKVAPLGDPIEVSIRGYELSLRKDEAALIDIG